MLHSKSITIRYNIYHSLSITINISVQAEGILSFVITFLRLYFQPICTIKS